MVTYCVTKIIPTCSLVIGQFFYTMIVASTNRVVIMTIKIYVVESAGNCFELPKTLLVVFSDNHSVSINGD